MEMQLIVNQTSKNNNTMIIMTITIIMNIKILLILKIKVTSNHHMMIKLVMGINKTITLIITIIIIWMSTL